MQNVANAARGFAEAVTNSNMYKEYQTSLKALKEDEELYKSFNEFRKEYYNLIQSGEDSFERMDAISQKYQQTLNNPKVSGFMSAEDTFCLNMKVVYNEIASKFDLDMDFINV